MRYFNAQWMPQPYLLVISLIITIFFLLNFCDHTLIRQPTVYDFMTNLSKYRNQSWKLWIFNEMVLFGVVDHLLIQWKKTNYSHDIQLKYVKCIR